MITEGGIKESHTETHNEEFKAQHDDKEDEMKKMKSKVSDGVNTPTSNRDGNIPKGFEVDGNDGDPGDHYSDDSTSSKEEEDNA